MNHLKAAWGKTKAWLKRQADVLERGVWTALQVVSAAAVVEFFELDPVWTVPIAAGLAFLKGVIARRYGNGSAATLPMSLDPVPIEDLIDVVDEIEAGDFGPREGGA
ncbi:MAG: hypothetical protein MUF33_03785 [Candidatus Nanopelagicales bacterium]|jgi:hypothetical protein|nr:hypothetical protein [Candidatus Nanopelagicales bacterium]